MKLSTGIIIGASCLVAASAFTSQRVVAKPTPRSFLSRHLNSSPSRPSSTSICMSSPMEFAKSEIAANDVVVFSKSSCPFCKRTKALFDGKKIEYKAIELNQIDNGQEIQDALLELTGQRTVPNVFIKGEHLGGNDDTQAAAASGKLDEMLAK